MIDKQRKIDPEKEARLREIDNYIRRNNYDKRMYRMLNGYHQHTSWGMPGKKNIFKNRSLNDVIDLAKEEFF